MQSSREAPVVLSMEQYIPSRESHAGHGDIQVSLLLPNKPVLQKLSYQYPLKLIAPSPSSISISDDTDQLVYTVFLLTYGGGLVAGDQIHLNVDLAPLTRLVLLTQGSTKIFKTPAPSLISRQCMTVSIGTNAALCYLPDPVQPFSESAFEQTQMYTLRDATSSLCVCDWVCEGRRGRDEVWTFWRYVSRNEVWWESDPAVSGESRKVLMLRDNVILDQDEKGARPLAERVSRLGAIGTLILRGPLLESVGSLLLDEFGAMPRIGSKRWDDELADAIEETDAARWRRERQMREARDGVVWTAACVRGCIVVKFGAREAEGAKMWLKDMLTRDSSVARNFGERALLCLR